MREIKFRQAIKCNVCGFIGFQYFEFITNQFFESGYDKCKCESGKYQINGDIQQYTGLKDKNGKEIYEGDIVKRCEFDWDKAQEKYPKNHEWWSQTGNEYVNEMDLYSEINRDIVTLERFRFWLKKESFGYEGEDLQEPNQYEIIGNIYENPELIKNETN